MEDVPIGLAHSVGGGGAGGGNIHAGALAVVFDSHKSGACIAHHIGDGIGGDPAGTLAEQLGLLLYHGGHASDAGGEVASDPFGVDVALDSGVLKGLLSGGDGVLDIEIMAAHLAAVQIQQGVEVLDLCRQSSPEICQIKPGDGGDAVLPGDQILPHGGHVVSDGVDSAKSGYNNSSHSDFLSN